MKKLLTLSAAVIAVLAAQPAQASSGTWNGTVNNTWAGANWSATPVPGSADTATFNNAGNGFTTIDLGAGVTVKSVTFDNTPGTLASYTVGTGAAGSETLTLSSNGSTVLVNSNVTNNQLINSNVVLGPGTAGTKAFTFTNNSLTAGQTLTFAGGVSGGTGGSLTNLGVSGTANIVISGSITTGNASAVNLAKSGTGTLILSGANSYTGATTVTAGALNLQHNSALGTGAGASTSSVVVSSGAALQLQGGISTTTAVALSLTGTGVTASPNGALENVSGSNTYSGAITATTAASIGSDAGTLTLTGGVTNGAGLTLVGAGNIAVSTGAISGGGSLTVASTGTVTLSNANTYSGVTSLKSGTVVIGDPSALGTNTVTLGDNTLTGAASLLTSTAVTFARNITEATAPTNTSLTIGGSQTSGTTLYSGDVTLNHNTTLTSAVGGEVDFNSTHGIKGAYKVTTAGGGTVKLLGDNAYSGGTAVTNGFLLADNAVASTGTGAVVVSSGGELGGTGKIATTGVTSGTAVDILSGGTLSPSNNATSFSHLTLALAANTTATLESGSLLSFNLGASTATSDEVLVTGGKLALNSQQFSDFTFNALSGITTGTYTLIDSSNAGLTGSLGSVVTGSLDGGLYTGTLSVSGNDLLLNITTAAVPEPGTWAMMLGGFCVLIVLQRTRRRNS